MQDYRLYFIGTSGRIESVAVLLCEDDDEAIGVASAHASGPAMELWQRGRLVKELPRAKEAADR
jgi:hypothetical protein